MRSPAPGGKAPAPSPARGFRLKGAGAGHRFALPVSVLKLYERQLRDVARNCAAEIRKAGALDDVPGLQVKLQTYSNHLEPWARDVALRMLKRSAALNYQAWRPLLVGATAAPSTGRDAATDETEDPGKAARHRAFKRMMRSSAEIGRELTTEMGSGSAIARVIQERTEENIRLIKDIPAAAARQIGEASAKAATQGERAKGFLAKRVGEIADMTEARALLIARTEVSKASTEFTRARAETVGSKGYIWRTAQDQVVRDSHADMEGEFVRWDDPPSLDGLGPAHAGSYPNCRCYPEVLL
jgi:SPP1 gp7 family putative phage head morphogenesis protein